jgi:hypothetical protein
MLVILVPRGWCFGDAVWQQIVWLGMTLSLENIKHPFRKTEFCLSGKIKRRISSYRWMSEHVLGRGSSINVESIFCAEATKDIFIMYCKPDHWCTFVIKSHSTFGEKKYFMCLNLN